MTEYKLNPFFRVTLEKSLKIEMPIEKKVFECDDYQLVQAITLLKETFSYNSATEVLSDKMGLSNKESLEILDELKNIGLIVDSNYHYKNTNLLNIGKVEAGGMHFIFIASVEI